MAQVGRISGPLLEQNLLRNGVDLAFSNLRTDPVPLLKLDVTNDRISINSTTPTRDLLVNDWSKTDTVIVPTSTDIGNLNFTNGKIENISGDIILSADVINVTSLSTNDLLFSDNFVTTTTNNSDLILKTNSTGNVSVSDTLSITNNLQVLGLTNTQSLFVQSDISSSLLNVGNFSISNNLIQTNAANGNLELRANGVGLINLDKVLLEQDITVSGTTTLSNISVTGNVTRLGNTNQTGNINLTGNSYVGSLFVDNDTLFENIKISQNVISTVDSNSSIELRPAGNVDVFSNLNIFGNLHSSNNITLEGNIIFGDTLSQDTVSFASDITSDIVPDQGSTYNLSSPQKAWSRVNSVLLNGLDIETQVVSVSGLEVGVSQGNIFYVSVNGDNAFKGDHQQGPFRTIKHALDVVDASTSGPVTILIYPGEYEEEFPLIVPPNVTVRGTDLRNTIIKPTVATQDKDVFLLDNETTIEDLTIKNFFYDSINDTGYAFRFNNNALISTRSPYIRNVSVITQGSVTTVDDPRGFDAGDAGKGALIDGAQINSASIDASMLFHSVTFITPGVDAVTMTNGVRVEWLNSFTYFANRGLYATQGATGRLTSDGSTIRYGAEIRSIGSANVYGNYGAVADGLDTLMYLIGHNFAYIGTGKDVSNDSTLVIQDNEVLELNLGKIYYTSTDAGGNYRVGDSFLVDFSSGSANIDTQNINFNGVSSINLDGINSFTRIDASKIDTGNLRFIGNTIQSISGDINWKAASAQTNLNSNVNTAKDLSITGNIAIGGNLLTLGNEITDSISFEVEFEQDLLPNIDSVFNLGSTSSTWNKAFLSSSQIDELLISNNFITTTNSDADLELRANSTGKIYSSTNVEIDNNLFVNQVSQLSNTVLNGQTTVTANVTHVGSFDLTGSTILDGNLSIGSQAQFENIFFDDNVITTTVSNSDLDLRANGTGQVIFLDNLEVINDFYVQGDSNFSSVIVNTSLDINDIIVPSNIQIDDNFIRTTISNSNLELRANGTGSIHLDNIYFRENILRTENSQDIDLNVGTNNLLIDSNKSLTLPVGNISERTNNIGDIRFETNFGIFEGYSTSNIAFSGVYSDNRATRVVTDNSDNIIFYINNNELGRVTLDSVNFNRVDIDDIQINGNVISTTVTNSDLELQPSGTGKLKLGEIELSSNVIYNVSSGSVTIENTSNGYSKFDNIVIPVGDDSTRGNNPQVGETRWNTQRNYMEVWNGTQWGVAAGGGEQVSKEYMEELLDTWTLILG